MLAKKSSARMLANVGTPPQACKCSTGGEVNMSIVIGVQVVFIY